MEHSTVIVEMQAVA